MVGMAHRNQSSHVGALDYPEVDGRCRNCGGAVNQAYCPACGQSVSRRLDSREVLSSLREQILDFDMPLLHTLRGLLICPGTVLRDYLQGRRKPYAGPFRFFLLLATVSVAATLLLGLDHELQRSIAAPNAEIEQFSSAVARFALAARPYLAPLILLPLAVLLARLWRTSGIRFAEAYAVLLFSFAFATVLHVPLALGAAWVLPGHVAALRIACLALVLAWHLKALFGGAMWANLWRTALLVMAYVPLSALVVLPLYALAARFGLERVLG